ncbi:MAG: DNA cytosine methyltransferase [Deltaproteobacteria bacterium]|nr:DNA cytosine methyltransferase [Deltaproteobacteria bacterium]
MEFERIPVIDLFAGPGGLGEGFSKFNTDTGFAFEIKLSIEKDLHAHTTLRLRRFFWHFRGKNVPEEYYMHLRGEITLEQLYNQYQREAEMAEEQAWRAELGDVNPDEVDNRLRNAIGNSPFWVLIGGPPCQAYSTAGRSRNKGVKNYVAENDDRHFLYREYLRIIASHWPSIFVMENVRGILSSKVNGDFIFEKILKDLGNPGATYRKNSRKRKYTYRLFSLAKTPEAVNSAGQPKYARLDDFVIRSEEYGVPQARHRVFLVGVREDIDTRGALTLEKRRSVSTRRVLHTLPRLRSGFSNGKDSPERWLEWLRKIRHEKWLKRMSQDETSSEIYQEIVAQTESLRRPLKDRGSEFVRYNVTRTASTESYVDGRLGGVCNSSTRSHMDEDLYRYFFAACYTKVKGFSPNLCEFPEELLPLHKNASKAANGETRSGDFSDRFRVQAAFRPATTVMSHISKDGHYYVHYDPTQCRSLTVREAARLQTFPDNYLFCGPRTQQYIQVGNAVPPLLAYQIAEIVSKILSK